MTTEFAPYPIYANVENDLGIDPKEQVEIDHDERFQAIVDKNKSRLLTDDGVFLTVVVKSDVTMPEEQNE